ncbi:MAG: transposase domain-containing protein [Clostridium sp.]
MSTIGCSLVESAKENGLIPRRYLNHLLDNFR